MRIAYYDTFGDPEVVKTASVNLPSMQDDEVLIKVSAVSYNYADDLLRLGLLGPVSFPHTVGTECSGVIADRGSCIKDFAVDDRVICALLPDFKKQGCSGEYIAVRPDDIIIAHAPEQIPLPEAAAIISAGLTAYQGIFEHLKLQAGQRIYIAGGAGGVGHYAVQMAKHIGAHVIASASAGALDLMRQFGADEVLDYREPIPDSFEKVEAVFNAAPLSEDDTNALLGLVKRGGRLVSVYRPASRDLANVDGIWTKAMAVHKSPEDLESLISLVEEGAVRPYIEKCYSLNEIPLCMKEAHHGHGKRLILLDDSIQ